MGKIWPVVMLVMCLAIWSPIDAGAINKQALTKEILERSGWMERVAQFPRQALRQLEEAEGNLSYENMSMLNHAVTQAYNVEALTETVIEQVAVSLDEKTLNESLSWFRSPLGQKISRLEQVSSIPHVEKRMEQFFAAADSHPPTASRLAHVRRLEAAMNSTELGEALSVQMAVVLTMAFNATRAPSEQINVEEIKHAVETQQREMRDTLEMQTIAGLIFLYHGLTDDELEQYVGLMESDAGRRFQNVVRLTLMKALEKAGQQMGQAFGEALHAIERREGV